MSKKKSIICTIILALLLVLVTVGVTLIPDGYGGISAYIVYTSVLSGAFLVEGILRFYRWLMEGK